MNRRAIPHRLLQQWGIATPGYRARRPSENYYAAARTVQPEKRAGYLLRAVCDLWEQQGAKRVDSLQWER